MFCISQKRIHEWVKLYRKSSDEIPESLNYDTGTKREHGAIKLCEPSYAPNCDQGSKKSRGNSLSTVTENPKEIEIPSQSAKQILDVSVEHEVYNWAKSQDLYPTSTEIRTKAMELYQAKGFDKIKCSYGWYRRWSERFSLGTSSHEVSDPIVLSWLLQQYDNNEVVTYSSLQSFAQARLVGIKSAFKASPGWATRFFKRHHVLLNWEGYNEKELPIDLSKKINEFHSEISELDWKAFQLQQIGCMDEIPLSFAGSKAKCSREVNMKTSRLKKISVKNCDATVILAVRADGLILPPMVVVKAQKSSSLNQVYSINDNPVVVYYSKTTEPSVTTLEKWMDLIWLKHVDVPSLLFYDSYDVHNTLPRKTLNAGVNQIMFPAGCSTKLQPINVYAKLTFQRLIDSYWEEYLLANNADLKIKLPSTNEIVEWISQAYETMGLDVHKVVQNFLQ